MADASTPAHLSNPTIAAQLENCPVMWIITVRDIGKLTAYATPSGLAVFLDFENRGGWIMLTECPSNSIRESEPWRLGDTETRGAE